MQRGLLERPGDDPPSPSRFPRNSTLLLGSVITSLSGQLRLSRMFPNGKVGNVDSHHLRWAQGSKNNCPGYSVAHAAAVSASYIRWFSERFPSNHRQTALPDAAAALVAILPKQGAVPC